MQFNLVVVRAFSTYAKGDLITDQEAIAAVLSGENADNVVRIMAREG